jgi:stage V sporulation protein AF
VEFFGIWGLIGGTLLWLVILFSTRSIAGKSYLYPFFPFDRKAILRLFFRHRSGREKTIG